ncbi:MAG: 5-methyltetrahydropteroyltriglutamate--homocysteine S-methyltransferase [Verrucomicrobiota bacterium]|nr:5-methyltetrahydropteroyltriglutamate--homocysteine S-methyltransferase [Verrucomicrobiota bacterium]
MKILSHNLGFPRLGPRRELKKALEAHWAGRIPEAELLATVKGIRRENWLRQKAAGIDLIPSNDFSLYDHVLDTCALVGAVPDRFQSPGGGVDLATYFAMARGATPASGPAAALEMTKWFDTNYHYLVPEFHPQQTFQLAATKPFDEFSEAKALGVETVPVLTGPVSFLLLGKTPGGSGREFDRLSLLPALLPVYEAVLRRLESLGARWVQFDEPVLSLDLGTAERAALASAYRRLRAAARSAKLLLAAYFGELRENLPAALHLPVDALHVDAVRAPHELARVLESLPRRMILSVGVVNGRNVWRNDFADSLKLLEPARRKLGTGRLMISPSCPLLHTPVSLKNETRLDEELKGWLAFAEEKLEEVVTLARLLEGAASPDLLAKNRESLRCRRESPRVHDPAVKRRCAGVEERDLQRASPYPARRKTQTAGLRLPLLPTTTIGSFPQTEEVRAARARLKKGQSTPAEYERFLEDEIRRCVRWQEETGLDVLVHGEFERNDMVEYFGEQLNGFAFTENGWVQSYGSRCVKPPIIFGDVARPGPMTVRWARLAQSLTAKLVKGMLTGPITMLQWSFVRDDQPRSETARQIALAVRDEVRDLEAAGIRVIQIDEPALREGLPLRKADWPDYLKWSVAAFRLAASGVKDATQIHTHMCYCEFNDIMDSIAALDADVISIEASRSKMELLQVFSNFRYPNEIGPGVWDIHSPRVPSADEMSQLIRAALKVIPPERLWVNPDCGLKTRRWEEVVPALKNMVEAAARVRKSGPWDGAGA